MSPALHVKSDDRSADYRPAPLPLPLLFCSCLTNLNNWVLDHYVGFGTSIAQQTRDVDPMLVWCWSVVCDAGPTLNIQNKYNKIK